MDMEGIEYLTVQSVVENWSGTENSGCIVVRAVVSPIVNRSFPRLSRNSMTEMTTKTRKRGRETRITLTGGPALRRKSKTQYNFFSYVSK